MFALRTSYVSVSGATGLAAFIGGRGVLVDTGGPPPELLELGVGFGRRLLSGGHRFLYHLSKPFAVDCLCDHRRARHLFVDALDGIAVGICSDEDDRYIAYLWPKA